MRVTRKLLIPYLIHSVIHTTQKEKIYWAIIFTYASGLGLWMSFAISWWFGLFTFLLALLAGRFPLHYKLSEIGQYPMSERQHYELIKKEDR